MAQDWRSRPNVDRRSNTGSAFANHHLTPFAPDLPSFTNEVCLARAPEIEANSVSEDFNGTLPCMVAMVARNYLDASGAECANKTLLFYPPPSESDSDLRLARSTSQNSILK